jgi:hypothetical protein
VVYNFNHPSVLHVCICNVCVYVYMSSCTCMSTCIIGSHVHMYTYSCPSVLMWGLVLRTPLESLIENGILWHISSILSYTLIHVHLIQCKYYVNSNYTGFLGNDNKKSIHVQSRCNFLTLDSAKPWCTCVI